MSDSNHLRPDISQTSFTYRRRIDPESVGLTYAIESANDLTSGDWISFTPSRTTTTSESPEIQIVNAFLPATAGRKFYRLRVALEEN